MSLPYKYFLGYEKGENGVLKIVEEETKIVRLIYKMFLECKTSLSIEEHLTENNILTLAGENKCIKAQEVVDKVIVSREGKNTLLLRMEWMLKVIYK